MPMFYFVIFRNMIMLSRRMRDGVRAGYCTVEEVADTKWKRLYPKIPKSGPDGKDGIRFVNNCNDPL